MTCRGWLALALALLAAPATRAADAGPPAPVPIPEVATRAEVVRVQTRDALRGLANDRVLQRAESRLPVLATRLDELHDETDRALDPPRRLLVLDQYALAWPAVRQELSDVAGVLRDRVDRLEREVQRFADLRASWEATSVAAHTAGAPQETLHRIDGTLQVLDGGRATIQARRDQLLVLQDKVADRTAQAEDSVRRLRDVREDILRSALTQTEPPIWSEERRQSAADAFTDLRRLMAAQPILLTGFFQRHREPVGLALPLFLLVLVALRRARVNLAGRERSDPRLVPVMRVLARPYASAIVLVLFATWVVSWRDTPAIDQLTWIVATVLVLRILHTLLDPALFAVVAVLGVSWACDRLRAFLAPVQGVEQMLFLAQLLGLLIAFTVLGWRRPPEPAVPRHGIARYSTGLARLLALATAATLVADAVGYRHLAELTHRGLVGSAFNAALLLAVVRVTAALMAYVLTARPFRLVRAVQHHGWAIHRRLVILLGAAATVLWLAIVLNNLELIDPVVTGLHDVLSARFSQGELSVSIGDIVFFVGACWLAQAAAKTVRIVLDEDVLPSATLPVGVPAALSGFVYVVVLFVGITLALAGVGIDVGKLAIFAGALGVGVGIGLQNIVNNFVSGLILLFERPVRVGDYVRVGGVDGEMRRIGVRSSTVRTFDGAEVIVPNANLVANEVTNWTLSDRLRRIDLGVGVAYASSPPAVLELLRRVADQQAGIVKYPPPLPLFTGFTDSALAFELRAWTDRIETWSAVRSDLAVALERALREAGIEIPYPQSDVRLRT